MGRGGTGLTSCASALSGAAVTSKKNKHLIAASSLPSIAAVPNCPLSSRSKPRQRLGACRSELRVLENWLKRAPSVGSDSPTCRWTPMGDEGKAARFPRLAALLSKARPHFNIGMPPAASRRAARQTVSCHSAIFEFLQASSGPLGQCCHPASARSCVVQRVPWDSGPVRAAQQANRHCPIPLVPLIRQSRSGLHFWPSRSCCDRTRKHERSRNLESRQGSQRRDRTYAQGFYSVVRRRSFLKPAGHEYRRTHTSLSGAFPALSHGQKTECARGEARGGGGSVVAPTFAFPTGFGGTVGPVPELLRKND